MSRSDPGHAAGMQVYPPPARRCRCTHLKAVHAVVASVRRKCSTNDCDCRAYHEGEEGT